MRKTKIVATIGPATSNYKHLKSIILNGANVIRVRHNQCGKGTAINECYLNIVIETRNFEHFKTIINALKEAGYTNITTKE